MRQHATDPQYRQDVLLREGAGELRWNRWIHWRRGRPARWQVTVIDNTDEKPIETAERLVAWMEAQRQLLARGKLPLRRGWHLRFR